MIRAENSHLNVVARSHPGMTGKNNEDRYAVSAFRVSETDATSSLLAVLSDGIGGHRAGEVAAEMAVELISSQVAESGIESPLATLRKAIVDASQQIYAHAQSDPSLEGMGGTCACAWIIGDRLYTSSVGDSRIYLLRGKAIRQISIDHTWIQEALELGILKREEVRGHPNAHVIRRFLGSPTPPQVDQRLYLSKDEDDPQAEANQGLRLHRGDRLLLCSDGLTDLVKDEEIQAALQSDKPLEGGVEALIQMACARGGFDNITLAAVEVPLPAGKAAAAPAPRRKNRLARLSLGCLGILLTALVVSVVLWSLGMITLPDLNGLPAILNPISATETPLPGTQTTLPDLFPTTAVPATPTFTFPTPTISFADTQASGPTYTPWPTNTPAVNP